MNITKITVGRLYNLGSYEHVRYELTVEVKDGESAATAITAIEKILSGLAPLKGIKSDLELKQKRVEIERMKVMPLVDWERQYGHYAGTAAEVIKRYEEAQAEEIIKAAFVKSRALIARQLFDDLGGAAQWKDAKLDWEDYDEQ